MAGRYLSSCHFFLAFFLIFFFNQNIIASTLNLSISSNPSRINPILSTDSASSTISEAIFSGLFKYDKDGKVICDMAKSYELTTPTRLKIKLKENILWHDGVKFTADDVIFTFNTINNPNIFTPLTSDFDKVKGIKKINDFEIEILYKEPYFKALNIWMVGMLPNHILKDEKDLMTSKFNKNPIGTGMYKLDKFVPSQDIILKANQNYYDGVPKIETIRYKFIPDEGTSFSMLKSKKLDVDGLTPLQIDRQLEPDFQKNFTIFEKQSFSYTYLGFNLQDKKWQNKKLREAINLAIDKKEMVDILFFSHGKVCTGPFLPNTFAFNDAIKNQNLNIKKSKYLLKELGYDEKNHFSFTVFTNANNPTRLNAALIMQHQLKKVHIDMKIKVLEWQAFLNTIVLPKKFDAILLGWGLSLMPDARSIWHSKSDKKGGFNLIGYKNETVDKDIELAERTTDESTLSKIYKEIFFEIANDLPYIFLYIPNDITAVSKDIKNVSNSLIGISHNQKEWIKEN
jgi:peptide/nickel transport system substrate-binding protein